MSIHFVAFRCMCIMAVSVYLRAPKAPSCTTLYPLSLNSLAIFYYFKVELTDLHQHIVRLWLFIKNHTGVN